jgi:hypothetical protein
MPTISSALPVRTWKAAFSTAGLAVGGALAMTVVLGAVAMLSAAVRGLPTAQVPLLLTTDQSFPWFCAAAGLFSALLAGYITTRTGVAAPHGLAAGVLTMTGHAAVVALLGSALSPTATVAYIGLTLPAVWLGGYLGSPGRGVSL